MDPLSRIKYLQILINLSRIRLELLLFPFKKKKKKFHQKSQHSNDYNLTRVERKRQFFHLPTNFERSNGNVNLTTNSLIAHTLRAGCNASAELKDHPIIRVYKRATRYVWAHACAHKHGPRSWHSRGLTIGRQIKFIARFRFA